jgi:hypothetical protein
LYFSGITQELTIKEIESKCFKFIWNEKPDKFKTLTEFYKNVLTSWIKTGGGQLSSPLTFSNVKKQILWGNRFITFEKKYIFFKEWINNLLDNVDKLIN